MLRNAEHMLHSSARIRNCSFDDIPIPISRTGVRMVNPWQDLKCVTYDIFEVAQDLLNDGEHADYAKFQYSPEFDDDGNQVYGEVWSANWWKREQALLGADANILAFILYIDETHVTYNGRNMHPIYMSLANLHLTYRCVPIFQLIIIAILKILNDFVGKNCLVNGCWDSYQQYQCSRSTREMRDLRCTNENSYAKRWHT